MTLYNIENAAKELGFAPVTVRRMLRLGKLSHRRIGNLYRFTQEDLDEFIAATKVPAQPGNTLQGGRQ
jgi:excisionase family DNA binding protein